MSWGDDDWVAFWTIVVFGCPAALAGLGATAVVVGLWRWALS